MPVNHAQEKQTDQPPLQLMTEPTVLNEPPVLDPVVVLKEVAVDKQSLQFWTISGSSSTTRTMLLFWASSTSNGCLLFM
jgi:hypothetical protein